MSKESGKVFRDLANFIVTMNGLDNFNSLVDLQERKMINTIPSGVLTFYKKHKDSKDFQNLLKFIQEMNGLDNFNTLAVLQSEKKIKNAIPDNILTLYNQLNSDD